MSTVDAVAERLNRTRFPVVLVLLVLATMACLMPAQSDTWWHLRAGEEIWKARRVILVDQFTHTVAGQRWPDHEWLTQVLFFKLYATGGMPLLTAFCAAAVTVAWTLVAMLTPGRSGLWRASLIGAGGALSSVAWSLRPQALTMSLFAATLWILVRRRGTWSLPLLFLIWANLHGAVALGGVLVCAAIAACLISRDRFLLTLLGVGALCFGATLATPLGWSLWLEMPGMIRRIQAYGISEWRAPGFTEPVEIIFWISGAALMALLVFRRSALRVQSTLTLAVSAVLLCAMATRNGRQMAPFFLCAVPTFATLIDFAADRHEQVPGSGRPARRNLYLLAGCTAVAAFVILGAWRSSSSRLHWNPVPREMISAVSACEGNLYNRYDEGGYLSWFLKNRKIFIDGRQDPFPEALVLEQMRVEETGDYRGLFERYGIACALTPEKSVLAASLHSDGWIGHPAGDGWMVFSPRRVSVTRMTLIAVTEN